MQRKIIEMENKEAKVLLKEEGLEERVSEIWKSAETQKRILEAYKKFFQFGKQLINSAPNELQVKGIVFLSSISKEKFSKDGFIIYENLIMKLKKALDIVKVKTTGKHMSDNVKQAIQETSELLLVELMQKVYEIPQNVCEEIRDFSKTL